METRWMGVVNLAGMRKTNLGFFSYVKCRNKIKAHFEFVCFTLSSIAVVFFGCSVTNRAFWALLYYSELPLGPRSSNIQAR